MNAILTAAIAALLGGIFAYMIGPYFSERFRLRTKLAETYLAPFKEWCADCYGELHEFNETYLWGDWSNISSLQIITDYRELHETLRYAPRWIGKIRKDKTWQEKLTCPLRWVGIIKKKRKYETVADRLLKLTKVVDTFWHNLEHDYSHELLSVSDVIVFMAHIKGLSNSQRDVIAEKIRQHLKQEKQKYVEKDISSILDYLKKEIP